MLLLGFGIVAFVGCDTKSTVTSREGGIQGKVLDKGGAGIPGVKLTWAGDPRITTQTDISGAFLLDYVVFGDQTFVAGKDGFNSHTFKATVYTNAITTVKDVVLATASFYFRDLAVTDISATTAVVSWKTSEFTNGYLEYGETETLGTVLREADRQYASVHSLTVRNLKPQRKYFFRVVGIKQGGSVSETSAQSTFLTLSTADDTVPPEPPKTVEVGLTDRPNQVTLAWVQGNDTDLKGYKIYRSELPVSGFTQLVQGFVARGQERFLDAGLDAGKKYYYRVSAIDQAGNEGGFSDIVSVVIPGDITTRVQWTRAHSPYEILGDIDIQVSGLLEIEAGVEVKMAGEDLLRRGNPNLVEMRVQGTIIASTASVFPVVFASAKATPAAGDWGGISFQNSLPYQTAFGNIVIAHAQTALAIQGTPGTFSSILIQNSVTGVDASYTTDLVLAGFTVKNCQTGFACSANNRLILFENTIQDCAKGVVSSQNDTVLVEKCNFVDFTETGLRSHELGGGLNITNNLFVSNRGLGLHILDKNPNVTYNTFDTARGILVVQGKPVIEKNIVTNRVSITGNLSRGIEYLASTTPLITFGPNNVSGYETGYSYVGCASTTTSLAITPDFEKDHGGGSYDYRLRSAIPDNRDTWGIRRSRTPL
jgi:hypothetical protein